MGCPSHSRPRARRIGSVFFILCCRTYKKIWSGQIKAVTLHCEDEGGDEGGAHHRAQTHKDSRHVKDTKRGVEAEETPLFPLTNITD